MWHHVKPACSVLFLGSILFGIIYPFFIWCVGHVFFQKTVDGCPITHRGEVVGYAYVGQDFSHEKYFWSRPSFAYVKNGVRVSDASNLSWSSKRLQSQVMKRVNELKKRSFHEDELIPNDLVMASASGLDPHISYLGALYQVKRVASVRKIPEEAVRHLIDQAEEKTCLGLFPRHIDVVRLNIALDRYCEKFG